jgi:hypothetical protein
MQEVSSSDLTQVATWLKDKPDGDLTAKTLETLKLKGANIIDLKEFAD